MLAPVRAQKTRKLYTVSLQQKPKDRQTRNRTMYLRDVAISRMKTGLGGTTGNKGGVSIRFTYYNSSLCFVCSHFAAHQNQIKQRNDDFSQIYENTEFPQVFYFTFSKIFRMAIIFVYRWKIGRLFGKFKASF